MPPPPHLMPLLVWVGRAPHLTESRAPLLPFTHLLAGAVASDLDAAPGGHDRVAIVTLEGAAVPTGTVERWDGTKFDVIASNFPVPFTATNLRAVIPPPGGGQPWHGRVFVLYRDDPLALPQFLQGFTPLDGRFDQIVYLTDGMLAVVPPSLKLGLNPSEGQAFYNGVVCTVVREPRRESSLRRFIDGLRGLSPWHVNDAPDPSILPLPNAVGEGARLFRDACNVNLAIDTAGLQAEWTAHDLAGRPEAFHRRLSPPDRARVRRWGRAVTNRRAGVAISGGGASAYRAVALLKELEVPTTAGADPIPVDVIAGLSGGALIAAYFSAEGRTGIQRAVDRGLFFQFALPIVLLTSWPLQFVLDCELDFTRIDETDVRYAALTTMHLRTRAPEAGVVTDATLGEAVRASGTLPPAFATTKKLGAHYTDGGGSALVPARLARECGADVILAVNVLSGPDRSNLLDFLPFGIGDFLYDYTPLSRLVDFAVWYTFMWRRASRRFGMLADEFLEYTPERIPMAESVFFWIASVIEGRGAADPRVPPVLARFRTKYKKLQTF
jgi:predicted patatin/cPLA2 family phospholipase